MKKWMWCLLYQALTQIAFTATISIDSSPTTGSVQTVNFGAGITSNGDGPQACSTWLEIGASETRTLDEILGTGAQCDVPNSDTLMTISLGANPDPNGNTNKIRFLASAPFTQGDTVSTAEFTRGNRPGFTFTSGTTGMSKYQDYENSFTITPTYEGSPTMNYTWAIGSGTGGPSDLPKTEVVDTSYTFKYWEATAGQTYTLTVTQKDAANALFSYADTSGSYTVDASCSSVSCQTVIWTFSGDPGTPAGTDYVTGHDTGAGDTLTLVPTAGSGPYTVTATYEAGSVGGNDLKLVVGEFSNLNINIVNAATCGSNLVFPKVEINVNTGATESSASELSFSATITTGLTYTTDYTVTWAATNSADVSICTTDATPTCIIPADGTTLAAGTYKYTLSMNMVGGGCIPWEMTPSFTEFTYSEITVSVDEPKTEGSVQVLLFSEVVTMNSAGCASVLNDTTTAMLGSSPTCTMVGDELTIKYGADYTYEASPPQIKLLKSGFNGQVELDFTFTRGDIPSFTLAATTTDEYQDYTNTITVTENDTDSVGVSYAWEYLSGLNGPTLPASDPTSKSFAFNYWEATFTGVEETYTIKVTQTQQSGNPLFSYSQTTPAFKVKKSCSSDLCHTVTWTFSGDPGTPTGNYVTGEVAGDGDTLALVKDGSGPYTVTAKYNAGSVGGNDLKLVVVEFSNLNINIVNAATCGSDLVFPKVEMGVDTTATESSASELSFSATITTGLTYTTDYTVTWEADNGATVSICTTDATPICTIPADGTTLAAGTYTYTLKMNRILGGCTFTVPWKDISFTTFTYSEITVSVDEPKTEGSVQVLLFSEVVTMNSAGCASVLNDTTTAMLGSSPTCTMVGDELTIKYGADYTYEASPPQIKLLKSGFNGQVELDFTFTRGDIPSFTLAATTTDEYQDYTNTITVTENDTDSVGVSYAWEYLSGLNGPTLPASDPTSKSFAFNYWEATFTGVEETYTIKVTQTQQSGNPLFSYSQTTPAFKVKKSCSSDLCHTVTWTFSGDPGTPTGNYVTGEVAGDGDTLALVKDGSGPYTVTAKYNAGSVGGNDLKLVVVEFSNLNINIVNAATCGSDLVFPKVEMGVDTTATESSASELSFSATITTGLTYTTDYTVTWEADNGATVSICTTDATPICTIPADGTTLAAGTYTYTLKMNRILGGCTFTVPWKDISFTTFTYSEITVSVDEPKTEGSVQVLLFSEVVTMNSAGCASVLNDTTTAMLGSSPTCTMVGDELTIKYGADYTYEASPPQIKLLKSGFNGQVELDFTFTRGDIPSFTLAATTTDEYQDYTNTITVTENDTDSVGVSYAWEYLSGLNGPTLPASDPTSKSFAFNYWEATFTGVEETYTIKVTQTQQSGNPLFSYSQTTPAFKVKKSCSSDLCHTVTWTFSGDPGTPTGNYVTGEVAGDGDTLALVKDGSGPYTVTAKYNAGSVGGNDLKLVVVEFSNLNINIVNAATCGSDLVFPKVEMGVDTTATESSASELSFSATITTGLTYTTDYTVTWEADNGATVSICTTDATPICTIPADGTTLAAGTYTYTLKMNRILGGCTFTVPWKDISFTTFTYSEITVSVDEPKTEGSVQVLLFSEVVTMNSAGCASVLNDTTTAMLGSSPTCTMVGDELTIKYGADYTYEASPPQIKLLKSGFNGQVELDFTFTRGDIPSFTLAATTTDEYQDYTNTITVTENDTDSVGVSYAWEYLSGLNGPTLPASDPTSKSFAFNYWEATFTGVEETYTIKVTQTQQSGNPLFSYSQTTPAFKVKKSCSSDLCHTVTWTFSGDPGTPTGNYVTGEVAGDGDTLALVKDGSGPYTVTAKYNAGSVGGNDLKLVVVEFSNLNINIVNAATCGSDLVFPKVEMGVDTTATESSASELSFSATITTGLTYTTDYTVTWEADNGATVSICTTDATPICTIPADGTTLAAGTYTYTLKMNRILGGCTFTVPWKDISFTTFTYSEITVSVDEPKTEGSVQVLLFSEVVTMNSAGCASVLNDTTTAMLGSSPTCTMVGDELTIKYGADYTYEASPPQIKLLKSGFNGQVELDFTFTRGDIPSFTLAATTTDEYQDYTNTITVTENDTDSVGVSYAWEYLSGLNGPTLPASDPTSKSFAFNYWEATFTGVEETYTIKVTQTQQSGNPLFSYSQTTPAFKVKKSCSSDSCRTVTWTMSIDPGTPSGDYVTGHSTGAGDTLTLATDGSGPYTVTATYNTESYGGNDLQLDASKFTFNAAFASTATCGSDIIFPKVTIAGTDATALQYDNTNMQLEATFDAHGLTPTTQYTMIWVQPSTLCTDYDPVCPINAGTHPVLGGKFTYKLQLKVVCVTPSTTIWDEVVFTEFYYINVYIASTQTVGAIQTLTLTEDVTLAAGSSCTELFTDVSVLGNTPACSMGSLSTIIIEYGSGMVAGVVYLELKPGAFAAGQVGEGVTVLRAVLPVYTKEASTYPTTAYQDATNILTVTPVGSGSTTYTYTWSYDPSSPGSTPSLSPENSNTVSFVYSGMTPNAATPYVIKIKMEDTAVTTGDFYYEDTISFTVLPSCDMSECDQIIWHHTNDPGTCTTDDCGITLGGTDDVDWTVVPETGYWDIKATYKPTAIGGVDLTLQDAKFTGGNFKPSVVCGSDIKFPSVVLNLDANLTGEENSEIDLVLSGTVTENGKTLGSDYSTIWIEPASEGGDCVNNAALVGGDAVCTIHPLDLACMSTESNTPYAFKLQLQMACSSSQPTAVWGEVVFTQFTYSGIDELRHNCSKCAAGYYSPSYSAYCYECPTNYMCDGGSEAGEAKCDYGTQHLRATVCPTTCIPGHSCAGSGADPVKCADTQYTNTSDNTCNTPSSSASGKVFRSRGLEPESCPADTYNTDETNYFCSQNKLNRVNGSTTAESAGPNTGYTIIGAAYAQCPKDEYCFLGAEYIAAVACPKKTESALGDMECTECTGGKDCGPGGSGTTCNAGEFLVTLAGSSSCVICPGGHEIQNIGDMPTICNDGEYSTGGTSMCQKCPGGSSCDTPGSAPTPCSAGSYSEEGDMFCHKCEMGKSCADQSTPGAACGANTFSALGVMTCSGPTSGKYIPAPKNEEIAVPTGAYRSGSDVVLCPVGKSCNVDAGETGNCAPGTYSMLGVMTCVSCPAGFTCLGGAGVGPEIGGIGKLCTGGNANDASCADCAAGSYCPTAITADKQACPTGSTAASGKGYCTYCENGKFCPDANPTNIKNCNANAANHNHSASGAIICEVCPDGSICPENWNYQTECPPFAHKIAGETTCTPVPNNEEFATTSTASTACAAGEYSTGLLMECMAIPAGYEWNALDATKAGPIPCSFGTTGAGGAAACVAIGVDKETWDNINTQDCPTGYYSPSDESWCRTCPPGFSCTAGVATTCAEGEYSPEGDSSCHTCTGNYGSICPESSGWPVPCPMGEIVDVANGNDDVCIACASGAGYSLGSVEECHLSPVGFYMPYAWAYPIQCPLGHYVDVTNSSSCTKCTDGYRCYPGSSTPTEYECPAGYYCEHRDVGEGTFFVETVVPCPAGGYTSETNMSTEADCIDAGHYTQCTQGYYCPPATTDDKHTTTDTQFICPKGHVCPAGTTFATQFPCGAGYYNPDEGKYDTTLRDGGDLDSYTGCEDCPAGYYCPIGSSFTIKCPSDVNCLINTGALEDAADDCVRSTGVYSRPGEGSCINCPKGAYCPIDQDFPFLCLAGTYNDLTNKILSTDCKECTSGRVCPVVGTISVELAIDCQPGYYCPQSTDPHPGSTIPAGNGIISTSPYEVPCPLGKYSDSYKATTVATCLACPAGYACPTLGTNKYTNPMVKCSPGYYCTGGDCSSASPTDGTCGNACPAGTYSNLYGLKAESDCLKCPAGYTCALGAFTPTSPEVVECPAGKYCPAGSEPTIGEQTCPIGYYPDTSTKLKSKADCIICPVGKYCAVAGDAPVDCLAGTYNPIPGSQLSSACEVTTAGFYNDAPGQSKMIPCGIGKYSDTGAEICIPCDLGHYCRTGITTKADMTTNICGEGYLCPIGTGIYPHKDLECPAGSYCEVECIGEKDCEAGTYNPYKGKGVSTDCLASPPGYYVAGNGATAVSGMCQEGYYCEEKSTTATPTTPCPGGTYRDLPGGSEIADCGECPAGFYCPEGSVSPVPCIKGAYCIQGKEYPEACPLGTFGPSKRLRYVEECTKCFMGRYCGNVGSLLPTSNCNEGFHCETASKTANPDYSHQPEGHPDRDQGWVCEAGGYCEEGSTYNLHCEADFYNIKLGIGSAAGCQSCVAGDYCIGISDSSTNGKCPEGYNCPTETGTPVICGAGTGCPTGSPAETICLQGTYSSTDGSGVCADCLPGFYCPGDQNTGTITPCTVGHYCEAKSYTPTPCPPGTYMPDLRAQKSSDCIPCLPGFFCTQGLEKPLVGTHECSEGFFCLSGASSTTPTLDTSGTPQFGPCTLGHFCTSGTSDPEPCPTGTFGDKIGLINEAACTDCTAGFFCPDVGMSIATNAPYACPRGYYCIAGLSQPVKDYICPVGSYCPPQSPNHLQCALGMYQDAPGDWVCKTCPKGYFCGLGTSDYKTNVCPVGYYCPEGTQTNTQYPCAAGTYNKETNAGSVSFCLACPPGYLCPTAAMTVFPTVLCSEGYYCSNSAVDTTELAAGTGGGNCTAGYYCPEGSANRILCDPGKYCSGNLQKVATDCEQGYFCTSGAIKQDPANAGEGGGPCPIGAYCPQGSANPILCPRGTYNANTNKYLSTDCLKCPDGQFCTGPGASGASGDCEAGYYCKDDSSLLIGFSVKNPPSHRCPIGYKCPGLSTSADKIDCLTVSKHQLYIGQSLCVDCPAGFECTTRDTETFCKNSVLKTSIYCPANQMASTSCGAGKINLVDGSSVVGDCKDCPSGYYCLNDGAADKLVLCPAGKFCSGGTTTIAGDGTCQAGEYCPIGSSRALPCPAGKYCDTAGMSTVVGQDCTAGYWCKASSIVANPTSDPQGLICPKGHYCPSGTIEPIACPHGNYLDEEGKTQLSDCKNCSAGYECPSPAMEITTSNQCPVNYYCPVNTTQGEHLPCTAGHKCPQGEDDEVLCPDGFYQPLPLQGACIQCPERTYCHNSAGGTEAEKIASAITPLVCPKGYFCPVETGDYSANVCPVGTFSSRTGLKVVGECEDCPPGYSCPNTQMTNADFLDDTNKCDAGYICLGKSTTKNPTDGILGRACAIGFYCEKGAVVDTPCPPGTFGDTSTQTTEAAACHDCPESHFCPYRGAAKTATYNDFDDATKCAAGYVCLVASITDTPYYPKTGLGSSTTGYYCPMGYKCEVGTAGDGEVACNTGTWQPQPAQGACTPSPAGRISTASGNPHSVLGHLTDCPTGKYCLAGSFIDTDDTHVIACPPGTYSTRNNLEAASECYPCDPGKYCLGGNAAPDADCDQGYACPSGKAEAGMPMGIGATTATPSGTFDFSSDTVPGQCPAGYYCPTGSRKPIPCPFGTYMTALGNFDSACLNCTATYYCNKLGKATAPSEKCGPGYMCLDGARSAKPGAVSTEGRLCAKGNFCLLGVEAPCPANTYEPREGSSLCQDCPKGYFCAGGGSEPVICPVGKYCIAKQSSGANCDAGTYSPATGLQEKLQCRQCQTGYYCPSGSLPVLCDPGYFCKSGATSATPDGALCPKGHYCPNTAGNVLPVRCPVGKVRDATGGAAVGDCADCSAGSYCIDSISYECPKGYFCIAQQNIGEACPIGKYRSTVGATISTECVSCTPGHYCNETAIPDQEYYSCLPGQYCEGNDGSGVPIAPKKCEKGTYRNRRGAASKSDCFECTGGSNCQEGTITPTACKEGTYCLKGSWEETICTAGNYCPFGTETPIICPGAYYCPVGSDYPKKCKNGFYCPEGTETPLVCPAGSMGNNNPANVNISTACAFCYAGYYSDAYYKTLEAIAEASTTVKTFTATVTVTDEGLYDETEEVLPECKICPAGYVCLGKTTVEFPTDKINHRGFVCPQGHYCPEGSYEAKRCPKGTFNKFTKMKSLEDCHKCDLNTYSYSEAQIGCLPCSKTSTAGHGAGTCSCKGVDRVFQFNLGSCLCRPNYKSDDGSEMEDSDSNCLPITYKSCPNNEIRGANGECQGMDDCNVACRGGKGKRRPGSPICICDTVKDVEETCDSSCRAAAPYVTLQSDGSISVLSGATGESVNVILTSVLNMFGVPKYVEGTNHDVRTVSMSDSGPVGSYNPTIAVSNRVRRELGLPHLRYLQSATEGIQSPILCIDAGASVMFDVSPTHYPVYLKDHLSNSNKDFDYGEFTNLENRISTDAYSSTNAFIYTFELEGVFVFGDSSNNELITIVRAVAEADKCADPDKYMEPITYDTLLKNGVNMRSDYKKEPNYMFIFIFLVIVFVGVPFLIWIIWYLHNRHKKNLALTQIQFMRQEKKKKEEKEIAAEDSDGGRMGTVTDDLDPFAKGSEGGTLISHSQTSSKQTDKTTQKVVIEVKTTETDRGIDPKLFLDIYQELCVHANYVKDQFMVKSAIDEKNLTDLYNSLIDLKMDMQLDLTAIVKIIGYNEAKNLFRKGRKSKEDKQEELVEKLLEYDQEEESGSGEMSGEDGEEADKLMADVMAEDEEKFNKVLDQIDNGKKEFLNKYTDEQSKALDEYKLKLSNMQNLDEQEKEELLREFDKQMLAINKMLLIEEEKLDGDLKEKINERKNRRNKLKDKLKNLEQKQNDARKQLIHDTNVLADERLEEERKIEKEIDDERMEGLEKINAKKKKKMDKYQKDFNSKMINETNQRKVGVMMEKYKAELSKMEQTMDEENQGQIADLVDKLEKRKQERMKKMRERFDGKVGVLNANKDVKIEMLNEETEKLTKHLVDEDLDRNLDEVIMEDEGNRQKEEEILAKLAKEKRDTEGNIKREMESKLFTLKTESVREEQGNMEEIAQEKRELEEKLKKEYEDARDKREFMKEQLANATDPKDKEELMKQIREFEKMTTSKLNAERDKQMASLQARLRGRRKHKETKVDEIKLEYEGKLKEIEESTDSQESELRKKIRNERLIRLIEASCDALSPEELPFAIDKIIEDQHMQDLAELLQTQFQKKAQLLKEKMSKLLDAKLKAIGELKEGFNDQYKRLATDLERKIIGQAEYERKMVDIKGKENDKMRDIELKFVEQQNAIEENMVKQTEKKHGEDLITMKEEQFGEKKRLLKKYVGDDLLEKALAGEDEWMKLEMEKYKAQVTSANREQMDDIENRKKMMDDMSKKNLDKITQLDYQTKKLMDDQTEREKMRMEKQKADMEKMKRAQEAELRQQGISEEQKKLLMEQHLENLKNLTETLDQERDRQTAMLNRKLEDKLKQGQILKYEKDQHLAMYKKTRTRRLDKKVGSIQNDMRTASVMITEKPQFADKYTLVINKYEGKKYLFDKFKEIQGVADLRKLEEVPLLERVGVVEKTTEKNLNIIRLEKFNFDIILEKITELENRVGKFKDAKFFKLIAGCKSINEKLQYLKDFESALKH